MGLEFTKEGHVAKVGLNVPETKNALSIYLLLELYEAWDECRKAARQSRSTRSTSLIA